MQYETTFLINYNILKYLYCIKGENEFKKKESNVEMYSNSIVVNKCKMI
jgi:hypothetical protein